MNGSSFRKLALLTRGSFCELCGFDSESNDVHHLKYKRLFDVTVDDVRILCRPCHDIAHALRDHYPKMNKLCVDAQWLALQMHIWKTRRIGDVEKIDMFNFRRRFARFRKRARTFLWFNRKQSAWNDSFLPLAKAISEHPTDVEWASIICAFRSLPMPPLSYLVEPHPRPEIIRKACPIRQSFFQHRQWMKSNRLILSEQHLDWSNQFYSFDTSNFSTKQWYDLAVSLGLETVQWPCGDH